MVRFFSPFLSDQAISRELVLPLFLRLFSPALVPSLGKLQFEEDNSFFRKFVPLGWPFNLHHLGVPKIRSEAGVLPCRGTWPMRRRTQCHLHFCRLKKFRIFMDILPLISPSHDSMLLLFFRVSAGLARDDFPRTRDFLLNYIDLCKMPRTKLNTCQLLLSYFMRR